MQTPSSQYCPRTNDQTDLRDSEILEERVLNVNIQEETPEFMFPPEITDILAMPEQHPCGMILARGASCKNYNMFVSMNNVEEFTKQCPFSLFDGNIIFCPKKDFQSYIFGRCFDYFLFQLQVFSRNLQSPGVELSALHGMPIMHVISNGPHSDTTPDVTFFHDDTAKLVIEVAYEQIFAICTYKSSTIVKDSWYSRGDHN
jgi:hypothetical protein